MFDSHFVYLYLGLQAPQNYIEDLFEVQDIRQVAMNRSEDQMFSAERCEASPFCAQLYALINQVRY